MYIRNYTFIKKEFERIFNKTIHYNYIRWIASQPKYRDYIQKLRAEYEKRISDEFLASPRNRLRAYSMLYDAAIEAKSLKVAREVITAIDNMFKDTTGNGGINVTYFQQNNRFSTMTIPQIKSEIARLCKMKIDDNVEVDNKGGANGLRSEIAQASYEEIKTS